MNDDTKIAPLPKAKWITSIQGLRAISFLAIFVSHSNLGSFGCLGAWDVSVFLMLSGFLMAYQYLQKPSDPVFGLRFAWNKVKSLYPLHLVTMVAKIPVAIFDVLSGTLSLLAFVVAVILNVGMAQIWVPLASDVLRAERALMVHVRHCLLLFSVPTSLEAA